MVYKKLINLTSKEFSQSAFLIAQRYIRLALGESKYMNSFKEFFQLKWPNAHVQFNEHRSYNLQDLRNIFPLPYEVSDFNNPASWYKKTYTNYPPEHFPDVCMVLLFYYGCIMYKGCVLPQSYEELIIQIAEPLENIPEVKHRYLRETFELAATYVLELTNDGKYYASVSEWFKTSNRNDYVDGTPPHYFPYKATGYHNSYTKALNKSPAQDKQKFAALVRQMLFNRYSEAYVGITRGDTFNIHFIEQSLEPRTECNHSIQQQLANHLAKAEAHFTIVENKMNTLTKFENQVSATVHLIHGRPADDYTETELMALIREAQKNKASLADLVDTSERMKAKSAQYDADIQVYVAALDSLK